MIGYSKTPLPQTTIAAAGTFIGEEVSLGKLPGPRSPPSVPTCVRQSTPRKLASRARKRKDLGTYMQEVVSVAW